YQDVEDAIRDFGKGEYRAAYEHLQSAKKSTPRLPPAEVMMAQLYFDLGAPAADQRGVLLLEQVLLSDPRDPEAYVVLAERALSENRATEVGLLSERAAKACEAFADNPERKKNLSMRTYSTWAAADELMENWKAAKPKLEQLLKLDPKNAAAYDR